MSQGRQADDIFYECGESLLDWRTAHNKAVAESTIAQLTTIYKDVDITKPFFVAATQQTFFDIWDARGQLPPRPTRLYYRHLHPRYRPIATLFPPWIKPFLFPAPRCYAPVPCGARRDVIGPNRCASGTLNRFR